MASGRFANLVNYNRRHLDQGAWEAWAATQREHYLSMAGSGNAADLGKAKAALRTLNRADGASPAIAWLDKLQHDILTKVMKPALETASRELAAIEKGSVARDRTGALRQSIGSTKAHVYPENMAVWIGSGPRRGYGRIIISSARSSTRKMRLKRTSKKFTERYHERGSGDLFANPVNYAHFLLTGRKASIAGAGRRHAKALRDAFTGRFFGHTAKAVAPKDFMAPAESAAPQAAATAQSQIESNLHQLFPSGDQP